MIDNTFLNTPLGVLQITGSEEGVSSISFSEREIHNQTPLFLSDAKQQLSEFFFNKRKNFTFKINVKGTSFQKLVWNELIKIPYGKTNSYKEIAEKIKNKNYSRAVGSANNKNPLIIVYPCHRVIGNNGDLKGYAYGLQKKDQLLAFEKNNL